VAVEGDVVGDDDGRQRHVVVDGEAALGERVGSGGMSRGTGFFAFGTRPK
jgi:hypothetical protein